MQAERHEKGLGDPGNTVVGEQQSDGGLRVLHVASSYPLSPGSSEAAPFMEEMLEALARRNHQVSIVVPRVEGLVSGRRGAVSVISAPYGPKSIQVWGYGRSLGSGNRFQRRALLATPLAMASMALKLRMNIRQERPDVVHLHWILPSGLLSEVVPADIPIVLSIHGADARLARGHLSGVVSRVLKRADAIIAASTPVLDFVARTHPLIKEKTQVIPHGANEALFGDRTKSDARLRLGVDPRATVLTAIGRLVRKKGFDSLIQSMAHLPDDQSLLLIAGDGPERANLLAMIADRNRMRLLGQSSREVVADLMAASDVVVVPSSPDGEDVDTGPVVLLEALAAGRPIVTTPVGMARDIIESGVNGVIVETADPLELAQGIQTALDNRELLGQQARQTFEKLGDWDRVAAELERTYRSLGSRTQR